MAGPLNVKVVKYPAIIRGELTRITLIPEIDDALDTIGERLERRGKGAGERRNQVNRERSHLSQRFNIEISHNPRRTGWAKKAYSRRIFASMAPNVIRKLLRTIQEKWVS